LFAGLSQATRKSAAVAAQNERMRVFIMLGIGLLGALTSGRPF
jgi:hypothetical protein